MPPDVLGAAFAAKPGEIFTSPTQAGVIVGRVDTVRSTPPAQLAGAIEQRRSALSLDLLQDIGRLARTWAQQALKVRTNPDRAVQALGVEPEALEEAAGDGEAPAAPQAR